MGSTLYGEGLDVHIALIEARNPTLDAPQGYPLPFLTPTAQSEKRTFGAWALENDYLKATFVPALGGRLWSLWDKRASKEILPTPAKVICTAGGPRGAFLDHGVQLRLNSEDRLNSLGPVQVQGEPEDGSSATLWMADIEPGSGLSFHIAWTLKEDEAALTAEVRVFNRGLSAVRYQPSLAAHIPGFGEVLLGVGRSAAYESLRDTGILMIGEREPLDQSAQTEERLILGRFASPQELAPRQTDQWSVRLVPICGLGTLTEASRTVCLGLGESLNIQASAPVGEGSKVFLQTQSGDRHEAPVTVTPSQPLSIPLSGDLLDPVAVAVQSSQGESLLLWDRDAEPIAPISINYPEETWPQGLAAGQWERLTFSPALRHLAHIHLGVGAFSSRDFARAYSAFESSLLFNSDDPLAWWAKAAAVRLLDEGEEGNDLLNAHYLAPLEPILRAESFLSQSQEMGKEPNPLLASLSTDHFVEVACLLIEHGLIDQAARWIDEAIRQGDAFMLRYLLAYCYLTGSRLTAEAAQQVELAGKLPDNAPYPWRPTERKVLARLHEDFSRNEVLDRRLKLLDAYFVLMGLVVVVK